MESRNRQIKRVGLGSPTYASRVGLGSPTPDQVGGRLYAKIVKRGRLTYAIIALCTLHLALFAAPFPFHLPPLSSSSVGSGLSTLAEGDDPSTVFWNPAGIAMMNQMSAQLTLTSFEGGKPASWSALVANSANRDASQFGLGLIRRHSSNSAGEFTSFEVLNPLAYRGIRSKVAWGFTPKFVAENFDGKWVYGMKLDAGVSLQTERTSGMTLAFVMQNFAGSNLRAFPWDSWGGLKSGSERNRLRMYLQVRLDKPFEFDYLSRNYRVGARLKPEDKKMPEVRAGLIRERGVGQYTAGLGYRAGGGTSLFEYAIVWNPDERSSFAHFLTYGYHVAGGTPTKPGSMSW